MESVTPILDEAIEELTTRSRKKWAVIVVALVAGAIAAVWLMRRSGSAELAVTPPEVETP